MPPDPPVLTLREVTGDTITISWTPAAFEGDGPVTGFHIESKMTNGDKTIFVHKHSPCDSHSNHLCHEISNSLVGQHQDADGLWR